MFLNSVATPSASDVPPSGTKYILVEMGWFVLVGGFDEEVFAEGVSQALSVSQDRVVVLDDARRSTTSVQFRVSEIASEVRQPPCVHLSSTQNRDLLAVLNAVVANRTLVTILSTLSSSFTSQTTLFFMTTPAEISLCIDV